MTIDTAELMAIRHAAGYTTSTSHWYIGAEALLDLDDLPEGDPSALHLFGYPVVVHAGCGIEFRP